MNLDVPMWRPTVIDTLMHVHSLQKLSPKIKSEGNCGDTLDIVIYFIIPRELNTRFGVVL